MAGMIDSFEAAVLDHITDGGGGTTNPTNWYVALYTAAPNEDGTGGTECSASEYQRQTMANTDWNSAASGQPSTVSNANTVTFPAATSSWGTITHFGLCSAATKGVADVQIWGALDVSKSVTSGDTVSFAATSLTVQLGDPSDTY